MKRQKLRYFESKMTAKFRQNEKLRIFREWTLSVIVDRESVAFLRSKYVLFWRESARKRKESALKYEAFREWLDNRTLNRLWFQWYLESLNRIEINDKMEIALQFHHQNARSMWFRSWKELVLENRKQKKLRKTATNFHRKMLKQKAFRQWHCRFVDSEEQREYDEMAMRFQRTKWFYRWKERTEESKYRAFNRYKATLFGTRTYFNRWFAVYEPFKIGYQYERELMQSVRPYMESTKMSSVSIH